MWIGKKIILPRKKKEDSGNTKRLLMSMGIYGNINGGHNLEVGTDDD